jgi:hypothetical protein
MLVWETDLVMRYCPVCPVFKTGLSSVSKISPAHVVREYIFNQGRRLISDTHFPAVFGVVGWDPKAVR